MIEWQATEEVARDIASRIVKLCQPERVLLFGSVARGDTHPNESDVDLLVVWDSAPGQTNRERRIELRCNLGFLPVPLDLLTYTKEEWEAALLDPLSFASQIVKEGQILYEQLR